jgi:hypothetical protein
VGLLNNKNGLLHTTAMMTAEWSSSEPGQWRFANAQNPIVFRSVEADKLNDNIKDYKFIFELVLFIKDSSGKVTQYSCGWADCDLENCKKSQSMSFDIKGGSPY